MPQRCHVEPYLLGRRCNRSLRARRSRSLHTWCRSGLAQHGLSNEHRLADSLKCVLIGCSIIDRRLIRDETIFQLAHDKIQANTGHVRPHVFNKYGNNWCLLGCANANKWKPRHFCFCRCRGCNDTRHYISIANPIAGVLQYADRSRKCDGFRRFKIPRLNLLESESGQCRLLLSMCKISAKGAECECGGQKRPDYFRHDCPQLE